ncbi:MAG TPA: thiaminase II [Thermomicrobiales bacterium]|nr:thiaminase II [Thermomicrobiales bacterium]
MGQQSFFAGLCAENAGMHHAGLAHPMVRGIGAGSLPDETFRFYIEQDYQFLVRYARVIAQTVAASPDLPTATQLANLLHGTLAVEIDALVELYEGFGGERSRLDKVAPAPGCQAYTDHLLACAATGNLLVMLAAILPCQWGYREIGRRLLAEGLPNDARYARWIQEYAADEYGDLVDWVIGRFDALAVEEGVLARTRAREVFALSTRYELGFWEMSWTRQTWARAPEPARA